MKARYLNQFVSETIESWQQNLTRSDNQLCNHVRKLDSQTSPMLEAFLASFIIPFWYFLVMPYLPDLIIIVLLTPRRGGGGGVRPLWHRGFRNHGFFLREGVISPKPNLITQRTGRLLLVWTLTIDLSVMSDPTRRNKSLVPLFSVRYLGCLDTVMKCCQSTCYLDCSQPSIVSTFSSIDDAEKFKRENWTPAFKTGTQGEVGGKCSPPWPRQAVSYSRWAVHASLYFAGALAWERGERTGD